MDRIAKSASREANLKSHVQDHYFHDSLERHSLCILVIGADGGMPNIYPVTENE